MTKKSRNNKKSGRKAKRNSDPLHQDMKQLIELSRAQEIRFVPEVMDVPRIRFNRNTIYNIELSYSATITLSTSGPTSGAISFSLGACANNAAYTTCFDQYRIIQCSVKFIPSGVAQGSGLNFYTVLDYDDANTLTSATAVFGYNTLKIAPAGVIEERTINPRLAIAAYAGSVFNGFANASNRQWIDSGSTGTQYYGVKYYVASAATTSSMLYVVTCMVQFRSQRD